MNVRSLNLSAGFLLASAIAAQAPPIHWAATFGGSAPETCGGVVEADDDGYLFTGSTASNNGDVSGNHGGADAWLLRVDAVGAMLWQTCLGGSLSDFLRDVCRTPDGGFLLVGETFSTDGDVTTNHGDMDVWVVKINATGAIQWQRTYGGSQEDRGRSIALTSDGGSIFCGTTTSNDGDVSGNHGSTDSWVVKLDASGDMEWQRCLGGTHVDRATTVRQCSDGAYILSAYTQSTDGDVTGNHSNSYDAWLVKLSATGAIDWERAFGGTDSEMYAVVQQRTDGSFIVASSATSSDGDVSVHISGQDNWVVAVDGTGEILWEHTYGGWNHEYPTALSVTTDGGVVIAGVSASDDGDLTGNHGQEDVWVYKLDAWGFMEWQRNLGGSDVDAAFSVQQTNDGSFILGAMSSSTNQDVVGAHGGPDIWAVKLTVQYNTISGLVYGDFNSNALHDQDEPTMANHGLEALGAARYAWTAPDGTYGLQVVDTGNFVVVPMPQLYYAAVPAAHTAHFGAFHQQDTLNDFALQPQVVANDLSITITPVHGLTPGFGARYAFHYANVGTTALAPTVVFHIDPSLGYDSASVLPTSLTADSITWELPSLGPLQDGRIDLCVTVGTSVPLGSVISSPVSVRPLAGDSDPTNNTATWDGIVTGAYDPNDILVNRSSLEPSELAAPPFLDYIIRFQNTGTDTAFTVRIEDPVPVNAQFGTFEFVGSSHPVQIAYNASENLLTFNFNNIQLPDSNINEEESHGYLRYRIKPLSTVMLGDSILNQAAIFFDYNFPVFTNVAHTVIETSMAIEPVIVGDHFTLYPNPSSGSVLVSTAFSGQPFMLILTDVAGREILRESMTSCSYTVDVSATPRGLYMVTVRTANGSRTRRLVLE